MKNPEVLEKLIRVCSIRELLELSYLHCYGPQGSNRLKEDWVRLYDYCQKEFDVGTMIHKGNSTMEWKD